MDGSSIESHGLTFSNLTDLDRVEHCDVICIPGGLGCVEAIENHNFLSAIRRFYEHYRLEPQLVIEEQSAREQELAADFDCLALKWMF